MTFEEWWSQQDYPARCKGNCQKAFEARERELIHKIAYKNVMKRQYRELRKKYDTVKPRVEFQRDLKLHKFSWFDITEWSQEEAEELVAKWKEIENRKKK